MSAHQQPTVAPDRNASHNATPSLADELQELRKLVKDRRAASFNLFRKNIKPSTLPRNASLRRSRRPTAA